MRSSLIGDMWRQRIYYRIPVLSTPHPTGATPAPRTWLHNSVDPTEDGTPIYRMEFASGHTIRMQGMIFDNLTSPEDSSSIPERLELNFQLNLASLVDEFVGWFEDQYGELFQLRSESHDRTFIGVIPIWSVEYFKDDLGPDNDEECKSLSFTMLVRESYRHD